MDDRLCRARDMIRQADEAMVRLFEQRMEAVKMVAAYKKEHHLPILDEKREQENITRGCALVQDEALRPFYADFLRSVMRLSRAYQQQLMEDDR